MSIRALLLGVACLACVPAPLKASAATGALDVQIEVRGSVRPDRVSLQSEDQLDPLPLEQEAQSARYSARVQRSALFPPGARTLSLPAQLVVNWPTAAESFFLSIGPTTPSRIRIGVVDPTRPAAFDVASLNSIDSLGRDFESVLQRYLMARRFYKHWRHTKSLPNHDIAIRSARIWFDAHTAMVTRMPAVFTKDPELADVLMQYKTASNANADVKRRFLKYFPTGLVIAANNQMMAAPFSAVSLVPKLVQAGQLFEARRVNTAAMAALHDGDDSLRKVVLAQQGVSTGLLEKNEEYIQTLMRADQAYSPPHSNPESGIH